MRAIFLAAAFLLTFAFCGFANAHGTEPSIEIVYGEYVVDIGYEPSPIVPGDRLVLDFNLKKEGVPVEFDDVWVRITGTDTTLLATGVAHAAIGPTTVLYAVPKDVREISITARFEKDGDILADTEFSLPITPHATPFESRIAAIVIGSSAVMLLSLFGFYRFYPHSRSR